MRALRRICTSASLHRISGHDHPASVLGLEDHVEHYAGFADADALNALAELPIRARPLGHPRDVLDPTLGATAIFVELVGEPYEGGDEPRADLVPDETLGERELLADFVDVGAAAVALDRRAEHAERMFVEEERV